MNTSKVLFAGLTIATLSTAPALFADDTEEQIKAREALQQKLNELNTQSGAAPAKPAPAKPKPAPAKPAPAKSPAPAVVPKPAPAKPVAQPTHAPAPAPKPSPVAAPAKQVVQPAPTPAPAPVSAPVVTKQTRSSNAEFSEVPSPSNLGNLRIGQANAAPTAPAKPGVPVGVSPAATQPASPKAGRYHPLVAPASPLSASKEAQLADLLSRYRADLITPEQYHTERAKIIAAP